MVQIQKLKKKIRFENCSNPKKSSNFKMVQIQKLFKILKRNLKYSMFEILKN
jgi:hypothetical protein